MKIPFPFKIDDIDGESVEKKGENVKLKTYINMPVAQCEQRTKNDFTHTKLYFHVFFAFPFYQSAKKKKKGF
jgi:hypothetical protein